MHVISGSEVLIRGMIDLSATPLSFSHQNILTQSLVKSYCATGMLLF